MHFQSVLKAVYQKVFVPQDNSEQYVSTEVLVTSLGITVTINLTWTYQVSNRSITYTKIIFLLAFKRNIILSAKVGFNIPYKPPLF